MANQVYSRSALRSGITVQSGQSTSFTVEALAIVVVYDAMGGPQIPRDDGFGRMKEPTEAGEYIIVGSWKHVSESQWAYSKIEWGSPLREQNGIVEVLVSGTWHPLTQYCQVTKADIVTWYNSNYRKKELPKTWVLNDFGHITCFIAKDLNHDGKRNKDSEKIHHQFFHPTPEDEAASFIGKEFQLGESHGCIHVKPHDMDEMISKGYMKQGNMVYIHDYNTNPLGPTTPEPAHPPYSLHFFPGIKKLFIKGNK